MINTILLIGNGKLSKSLQPYLTNYNVHIFDVNNIEELLLYKGDLLIDCSSSFSFDYISLNDSLLLEKVELTKIML